MCNLIQDEDVKKYIILNGEEDDDDEEELINLGLDEYEIEEVKKGNQSPFDFNDDPDEEFEDDDYYGEDDIQGGYMKHVFLINKFSLKDDTDKVTHRVIEVAQEMGLDFRLEFNSL